jgi:hypothetical protein
MGAMRASIFGSACLVLSTGSACADCSAALNEQIVRAERIVDSLRPDKAGQMRVFATDGSEYTADQAQWMKVQMRAVHRSCSQGDESAATAALMRVTEVLNSPRGGI